MYIFITAIYYIPPKILIVYMTSKGEHEGFVLARVSACLRFDHMLKMTPLSRETRACFLLAIMRATHKKWHHNRSAFSGYAAHSRVETFTLLRFIIFSTKNEPEQCRNVVWELYEQTIVVVPRLPQQLTDSHYDVMLLNACRQREMCIVADRKQTTPLKKNCKQISATFRFRTCAKTRSRMMWMLFI